MITKPAIVVTARLNPDVMEKFEIWHRQTHLPHILAIPGIVAARRIRHPREIPGTHQMRFELEDEQAIQRVMGSAEAQIAQRDWTEWASDMQELSVQIYTTLGPLAQYHLAN